ncbi:MAG: hypothetical protein ACJAXV_001017, partial [Bacteroidia bacterium]
MNSKKSTMNKIQNILLVTTLLMSVTSCKEDPVEQPSTLTDGLEGYSLIWSDEFNDGAVNLSNWVYETGDGTAYGLPAGWGNSELQ